jgi:hypothetical protein
VTSPTLSELRLESVRKGRGKIHLTIPAPAGRAIETLCGIDFHGDEYEVVEEPANCRPCLRRRDDPSVISAAFFEHGAGSELLELSLARARERPHPPRAKTAKEPKERVVRAAVPPPPSPPPPPPPERIESRAGVVLRTPGGVLREASFEGAAHLRRLAPGRFRLELGDVEIDLTVDGSAIAARPRVPHRRV